MENKKKSCQPPQQLSRTYTITKHILDYTPKSGQIIILQFPTSS